MLLVGLTARRSVLASPSNKGFAMLKKFLLVLLVAIVALLGYAWTRPDTYTVTRSAVVPAPPERVFALIDDFHHWAEWSPWQKLDPAMRATYSGPASGVGAVYAWEGNKQVGKGRMEITESVPPRKVGIKLDFIEPFASNNTTDLTLAPEGTGTRVTWTMTGNHNFMSKLMSVFVSMDAMIGKDFERGLDNLKTAVATPG